MVRRLQEHAKQLMSCQCSGTHQYIVAWACNVCVDQCIDCCGSCYDISAQHVLLPPRYLLRDKARLFKVKRLRSPL